MSNFQFVGLYVLIVTSTCFILYGLDRIANKLDKLIKDKK